jgi:hypothetical protein
MNQLGPQSVKSRLQCSRNYAQPRPPAWVSNWMPGSSAPERSPRLSAGRLRRHSGLRRAPQNSPEPETPGAPTHDGMAGPSLRPRRLRPGESESLAAPTEVAARDRGAPAESAQGPGRRPRVTPRQGAVFPEHGRPVGAEPRFDLATASWPAAVSPAAAKRLRETGGRHGRSVPGRVLASLIRTGDAHSPRTADAAGR